MLEVRKDLSQDMTVTLHDCNAISSAFFGAVFSSADYQVLDAFLEFVCQVLDIAFNIYCLIPVYN